jgi:copper chaperone CopZ
MGQYHIRSLFFVMLLCCMASVSYAQFTQATIGVNGLTCSQCSRSVEMRIRKLDFVQDVHMDLQHTEGTITFKSHEKVDISKIAQAVTAAGFSVRYLAASLHFDDIQVSNTNCFNYLGDTYQFIKPPLHLDGTVTTIKFIGPGYLPKKELSVFHTALKNTCGNARGKLYYITM